MRTGDTVYTATVDKDGRVCIHAAVVDYVGTGWAIVSGDVLGRPVREGNYQFSNLSPTPFDAVSRLATLLLDAATDCESLLITATGRLVAASNWLEQNRGAVA